MSDSLTNKKLRQAIVNHRIFCDSDLDDRNNGSITQEEYVNSINRRLDSVMNLISDTVAKAEREAKLNLAKGLTIGGRHGVDIFYQGIPIERFIDKLKSQQESEES